MSYPDTAELWRSNGQKEDVMPANGATWELEELQEYVGGLIEVVPIKDGQMIVNEEGLLEGLSHNVSASLVAHRQIVGDVVLSPEGMLT